MSRFSYRTRWTLALVGALVCSLGAGLTLSQTRAIGEQPAAKSKTTPQDAVGIEHAKALSHAFHQAAEAASPSVVKIQSHTAAHAMKGMAHAQNPFKGTPFEDMIPNLPNSPEFSGQMPQHDGVGSGVIVDKSGIVLTNNHVVQGADEVTVRLSDGREFKATNIKTDPDTDLAVLRIKDAKDLPAAKLGNSDDLEVGDWVIAIGCPFELEQTVSAGIISSKGRELDNGNRARFLQTDAAINPGNSGGPLVNLDGEVVGINTAIASSNGGNQGIGFSIPINLAKWVMPQLIEKGSVARGYLGVQLEEITADLAEKLGLARNEGILAADVLPNAPAAAAGLHAGDVITSFAGTAVHDPRDLRELVERAAVGSKQTIQIKRDGKSLNLDVVVKALPAHLADNASESNGSQEHPSQAGTYHSQALGLEVANLTDENAQAYKGIEGVMVTGVDDDSPAARKGLQAGMLIRQVGNTRVKNVEQFAEALKHESPKNGVLMQVRTPSGNHFVVLKAS